MEFACLFLTNIKRTGTVKEGTALLGVIICFNLGWQFVLNHKLPLLNEPDFDLVRIPLMPLLSNSESQNPSREKEEL